MRNAEHYTENSTLAPHDNALVVRLERNQKDVKQLRNQLNSYCCEPQTYVLFERIEALKEGLESLNKSTKEVLATIRERKTAAEEYREGAKRQLSEFQKLQLDVEEYKELSRSYSNVLIK